MTKFFKYLCIPFLMVHLTSCDEAEEVFKEDPLDSFEILKSHQWAVEEVKVVHIGNVIDLQLEDNGIFPFCAQDNFFTFEDDGTIENLENTDVCIDVPTIKAYIDGNWISSNNKDSLIIINSSMVMMVGTMNATSENNIDLDLVYDVDWKARAYNLRLSLYSVDEE